MKYVLRLEELVQTVLSIGLISFLRFRFGWWLWIILFLSPDISMLGYAVNKNSVKLEAIPFRMVRYYMIAF